MKKITLFVGVALLSLTGFSQDAMIRKIQLETNRPIKKDITDTLHHWFKGGVYSINLGQGSLTNWAAGGDEFSLTINSFLNLFAFYKKGKMTWDNSLDLNFGYVKTSSLGSRKNDDRFDFVSKVGYSLNHKLSLAVLTNFRSQFVKGYTYPNNVKKFSSDFLAPGYVLVSLGLDYKPAKNLSIFVSPISSRWVIVKNDTLSARGEYGVTPGHKSASQLGSFATITYFKAFNKLVSYKGRMDLFSNYKHKPQNVDLYMTNQLAAKISKVISMNWTVDLIYDDDVRLFGPHKSSPALQVKSIIGAGLLVKFQG